MIGFLMCVLVAYGNRYMEPVMRDKAQKPGIAGIENIISHIGLRAICGHNEGA